MAAMRIHWGTSRMSPRQSTVGTEPVSFHASSARALLGYESVSLSRPSRGITPANPLLPWEVLGFELLTPWGGRDSAHHKETHRPRGCILDMFGNSGQL